MNDGTADQHADVVGLLRGELGNADVLDAEDHLHTCADCRDDLVATAAGHALLSRASGVLGDLDLPAAPPFEPRAARRHRPRPGLVAAAAAVLVAGVGLGVGGAALLGGEDSRDQDLTAQSSVAAPLGPVEGDIQRGQGEVRMTAQADHSMRVTVQTDGLPQAPRGDFYYVWLLDPDTNKMLPLGLVAPGGTATFRIDADLVASYGAVDVSLEADDGDPAHSVTSVLRGSYDLT